MCYDLFLGKRPGRGDFQAPFRSKAAVSSPIRIGSKKGNSQCGGECGVVLGRFWCLSGERSEVG